MVFVVSRSTVAQGWTPPQEAAKATPYVPAVYVKVDAILMISYDKIAQYEG